MIPATSVTALMFLSRAACAGTATNYMTGNDVFYSYTPTADGAISIAMTPTANWSGIFVYDGCANVGVTCVAGVANTGGGIREIPSLAVIAGHQYVIVISTNATPQTIGYTLCLQQLNCAPPTGLSAVSTGPTSANLSWQSTGGATSWEVFVQPQGGLIPTTAGTTTTVNTNYGITTLADGTPLTLGCYQYWARADCGDGTFSPWAGPYAFCTTTCSSGCNYSFVMTDSFGDGWNGNTMTVTQGASSTTIGSTFTNGTGPVTVPITLCDGPFTLTWNTGGSFANEVGISVVNSFGQTIYTHASGANQQGQVLYTGTVDCANPLCLPPTNLTFSNITTNGATLAWVPNGPAPLSWDIYAVQTGSPAPDATTVPTVNTTNNPYTIGGLLADTAYTYYVRAVCSGPGANPWSVASASFTTLPTCPKPTVLSVSGIDQTQATFNWTVGGTETAWQVIAVLAGSPTPTPASPWIDAPTHPFTIPGLISGTSYDFYVRAICTPTDASTPAGPLNFNTSICPAADQCLYTFTMTDSFGDGWNGNTMNVLQNGITVATIGSTFTTGTGPVTVQVPLCNGIPFELHWNTGGAFATEVGVSITSFLGEAIYTHSSGTNEQGTTLYQGTGECIPPTCLKPTGVVVTNISLDSATVSWTDNNTPAATSWDVLVLPSTDPAPGPTATGWTNVSTNPYALTGLSAATCYKVYVRAKCSDTDSSFWSLGGQFCTVICLPSNLCEYTFTMVDSYGDSWNGNTMNVTQNGIVVATLTGPTNADGQNPISQVVSLCNSIPFELFWNNGGAFANEVGISITNASETVIFEHTPGSNAQGTTLFSGTVSCVPPTCPKPVQLLATAVTETTATLNWVEASAATAWQVIILPAGSPPPASTAVGQPATSPYLVTDLISGTSYVFYVRAICSDTDVSNWAGPSAFATLITNDECSTATVVPVNGDQSCAQTASGTLTGATASGTPTTCGGTPDDDVWFTFTATGPSHTIDLTNVTGSTTDLYHVLYQGDDCGNLTQVYCSDDNQSIASNLTPGQVYHIRVFSWTSNPGQTSVFNVCIGTIPPPISSSTSQYTPVQLVEDILLNTTCASVTNVTFSTGTNFGSTNGIGYFEQNGSSFPFENGVVLTSGNADSAPGPNTNVLSDGTGAWPGDTDLQAILTAQSITGTLGNATKLEFDFVPITDNISFNFIFASDEYGTFQCQYSDVFAFLLTDTSTGITTNLAVVPNTTTPVSVVNIRDTAYNTNCPSVNPAYFGAYYELPEGQSPLGAPINFNGRTIPLTATSPVTPGVQYHIKLAIADFGPFGQDNAYDSAVFLEGGSFGIGNIDLGDNLLESTGNAICNGNNAVISTALNPALYNFSWLKDGVLIPNETSSSITVTEQGTYTIQVNYINTTCVGTDDIIVEFYDPVAPGTPADLYVCNATGTGVFDLTQNQAVIVAPMGTGYSLGYYLSMADATSETNAIVNPTAYTNVTNPQTIYVRVENDLSGCFGIVTFNLIVQDLTPQFTLVPDFSFCDNTPQTITVNPINFNLTDATYTWTMNGVALPDTGSSIIITQSGLYEVTVDRGCTATLGVTATSVPTPIVTTPGDQVVCSSTGYTLPVLTVGSYFTDSQANGGGTPLFANEVITGTQTIWIYAESGTVPNCFDERSFTVTVNSITADDIDDVVSCTGYTLLPLSAGNTYWTLAGGPAGGGTQLFAGDVVTTNQTVYVYAETGTTPNCVSESDFTVTIGTIDADELLDVTSCDSYTLPALSANNTYWTLADGPAGGGTQLFATNVITTSQTIHVYAQLSAACVDESDFAVTINITPVLAGVSPVTVCDSYTLPTLAVGNYYDGPDGTGNLIPGGTVLTAPFTTVYVYAQSGTAPNACPDSDSFTVTINPTPDVAVQPAVNSCGAYELPVLTVGNYFEGTAGSGTQHSAGEMITTDITLYVYASNGACSDEETLVINIGTTPEFTIGSGCDGSNYVLTVQPVNFTAASASYAWSASNGGDIEGFTDGQSIIATAPGDYSVTVTSDGCPSTLPISPESVICDIQKGVSANHDGTNDTFDLAGQDVSKLEIFNRYGLIVYHRNNYIDEWHGQSDKGDELPDGTYYYVIDRGAGETITGWIYLSRMQN
jgi:gliding motility-associated-like protein